MPGRAGIWVLLPDWVCEQKLLKAIWCPCRCLVQRWEQVVLWRREWGGGCPVETVETELPVYALRLSERVFRFQATLLWDRMLFEILTARNPQQLKSLLCFCCLWSELKVNGQVFGVGEQCVSGLSATSPSECMLAVGTVTGLAFLDM